MNLTETFSRLTSLQYMHIVKLISSFALFSWQRDKKNKASALVRSPLFPIFSKFCKQSKCHSKFKVSNSLQIVLKGPSINKVVPKFGVFTVLTSIWKHWYFFQHDLTVEKSSIVLFISKRKAVLH